MKGKERERKKKNTIKLYQELWLIWWRWVFPSSISLNFDSIRDTVHGVSERHFEPIPLFHIYKIDWRIIRWTLEDGIFF